MALNPKQNYVQFMSQANLAAQQKLAKGYYQQLIRMYGVTVKYFRRNYEFFDPNGLLNSTGNVDWTYGYDSEYTYGNETEMIGYIEMGNDAFIFSMIGADSEQDGKIYFTKEQFELDMLDAVGIMTTGSISASGSVTFDNFSGLYDITSDVGPFQVTMAGQIDLTEDDQQAGSVTSDKSTVAIIDSGILANDNITMEVVGRFTELDGTTQTHGVDHYYDLAPRRWRWGVSSNNTWLAGGADSAIAADTDMHTFTIDGAGVLTIDGSSVGVIVSALGYRQDIYTIGLFGALPNNDAKCSFEMVSAKFWDNGVLVGDFTPQGDGTLYDSVSDSYFGAGSNLTPTIAGWNTTRTLTVSELNTTINSDIAGDKSYVKNWIIQGSITGTLTGSDSDLNANGDGSLSLNLTGDLVYNTPLTSAASNGWGIAPQVGDFIRITFGDGTTEDYIFTQVTDRDLQNDGISPFLGKFVWKCQFTRRDFSHEVVPSGSIASETFENDYLNQVITVTDDVSDDHYDYDTETEADDDVYGGF